jgi:hypothetical protein
MPILEKSNKKSIIIEIEFSHFKDLEMIFHDIVQDLKGDKLSARKEYINSSVDFQLQFQELKNFREEIINGQICQIYKSKI